jgi:hypothetical protein
MSRANSLNPINRFFRKPLLKLSTLYLVGCLMVSVASMPAHAQASIYEPISIDFNRCRPTRDMVNFGLGTAIYEVVGKSRQGCVMLYGIAIETRRWNEFLDQTCIVPSSLKQAKFSVSDRTVDFSTIRKYCVPTPKTAIPAPTEK